jgi:signal transduction histidine kinase
LLVAKESAEAASELKNNFLTNISHEIRTPMNGVLGLMELLQEGNLTEQQREHLTWAQASGNQLLVIINDILDLSNMESGAMKLELSAIFIQDVLDQLFDSFRLMALKKDVKLSINVSDKVPAVVMTDATHIRKIFSHLIDNAIKFTNQGEINVWLDAGAIDHDKNSFQLYASVKDSGIGFDMSRAENLFLPFVQGDNSLTRAFGGSGLGLAIVRKLVQRLGGDIQATSRPGVGSEFSFHILCLPSPNKT